MLVQEGANWSGGGSQMQYAGESFANFTPEFPGVLGLCPWQPADMGMFWQCVNVW